MTALVMIGVPACASDRHQHVGARRHGPSHGVDFRPSLPELATWSAALEAARTARFTEHEWDTYVRAGIAIQDALSLAEKKGREEGLRAGVESLCEVLGIDLTPARRAELASLDAPRLEACLTLLKTTRAWS